MSDTVTLLAKTAPLERDLRMESRTITDTDVPRLGELYFSAYDPGAGAESPQSAVTDVQSLMNGDSGVFLSAASPVALDDTGEIIAAIMVVEHGVADDAADAPLILELFTDRHHRRQGLAEQLVLASLDALFQAGYPEACVRVDGSNSAAMALYLSLDFRLWSPDAEDAED